MRVWKPTGVTGQEDTNCKGNKKHTWTKGEEKTTCEGNQEINQDNR